MTPSSASAAPVPTEEFPGIDPARIAWIAGVLSESPSAAGAPVTDRPAWAAFAKANPGVLERARRMLGEPRPAPTEEQYLLFSKVGTRTIYEHLYRERMLRLATFCLAECICDAGEFLPCFEAELRDVLAENTWVMPAHDNNCDDYYGRVVRIDLGAAMRGAAVATAVSWLGGRLPAALRDDTLRELDRRLFAPYLTAIHDPEGQKTCRWLRGNTNWNAVCTAGVVTAALAMLPGRAQRAVILAGAEKYVPGYLAGFTADGYCSEGLGYWNYGFGHYIALAEIVLKATSGALDFYNYPAIRAIASFPFKLEMAPGLYPAFADCPLYPQPEASIQEICDARLFSRDGARTVPRSAENPKPMLGYQTAVSGFPLVPRIPAENNERAMPVDPLRGWFENAGVLVCRIAKGDPKTTNGDNKSAEGTALSVALKGGHNAEHHNHNDLGSFVIAQRGRQPVTDPGKEDYTRETFSPRRYNIEMINSSGHPVPVVAGVLQSPGLEARAIILETSFTPAADHLRLDLRSAYAVPTLQKLERAFTFTRASHGTLTVEDTFEFTTPETFETALITFGTLEQKSPHTWLIRDTPAQLLLTINTHGAAYETEDRPIRTTDTPVPRRLAIRLKNLEKVGVITTRFEGVCFGKKL